MPHDSIIHVRVGLETEKKLDVLSRTERQVRSAVIRQAIDEYYARHESLNELKKMVAEKFARGHILFDDLVRVLGYEEAKKVAYFVSVSKESFTKGLKG